MIPALSLEYSSLAVAGGVLFINSFLVSHRLGPLLAHTPATPEGGISLPFYESEFSWLLSGFVGTSKSRSETTFSMQILTKLTVPTLTSIEEV